MSSSLVSKALVLLLGLTVFSNTLVAQSTATTIAAPHSSTPPDSGAVLVFKGWYLPRYQPKGSEADTTGALLSLFRKRRMGGWAYVLPFMAGMSLALPMSSTDSYGRTTTITEEAIAPPLGITVLSATVAGFIVHATSFNKKHLVAVDHAYAAGKPIPAKYRRKLRAQHFADASYVREALRQQMERERLQTRASLIK